MIEITEKYIQESISTIIVIQKKIKDEY